jgi:hypothetical protein
MKDMMHTRRVHARLAYVMRVNNRGSVAYAAVSARKQQPPRVAYVAASERSVRRGLLSPEAS